MPFNTITLTVFKHMKTFKNEQVYHKDQSILKSNLDLNQRVKPVLNEKSLFN